MPNFEKGTTKNPQHPNIRARILPHNDEAEQALLGCALLDYNVAIAIVNELDPDDFYSNAHREIFRAMQSVMSKPETKEMSLVLLEQAVEELGTMEMVGGMTYLSTLTTFVISTGPYRDYLNIVQRMSTLRKLIASSQRIMDRAYSFDPGEDALQFAEGEIYSLAEKKDRSSLININEAAIAALEDMDEKQRNPALQKTIPIPFVQLNELLGGFHRTDLILIAARPGQGKTSLGMNLITHAALTCMRKTDGGNDDPFRCAVFSLEMSAEQLATRMLCSIGKVNMSHVMKGKRTNQETMRLVEAQKRLASAKIFVDDSSLTTPIEILSKCRRLSREHGEIDLVMVDYLQLMSSGKRVENRQQEVSEITRTMKIAAKELEVPILLLSQMSRDIEKRTDKTPQMSDLRESGAIEQDADIIIFLNRKHDPTDQTIDEDTRTKCDLIVAKHRNGETGTITVRWHGEYTTFTDIYEKKKDEVEERKIEYKNDFTDSDGEIVGEEVMPPAAPVEAFEPSIKPKKKSKKSDETTPAPSPESDETTPAPSPESDSAPTDDDPFAPAKPRKHKKEEII